MVFDVDGPVEFEVSIGEAFFIFLKDKAKGLTKRTIN